MVPTEPDRVKLFVSVLSRESELIEHVVGLLSHRFGRVDYMSTLLAFDHTDYYEAEMGRGLVRRMVSFEPLVEPDRMAEVKLFTNSLEARFLTGDGRRRVNIDPGYLALDKVVLLSCKNFSHRIYLKDGVYAEVTLRYSAERGGYTTLEWTYPDYGATPMLGMFGQIRRRYSKQIGRGYR